MKKRACLALCVLVFGVFLPPASHAQRRKVTIKLASLVPEATAWGAALNKMAKEWQTATNGEVELIVYHNGVAGEEGDVLRKLKLNQIQAAVLTSFGMNLISPQVMSLSFPFLIRNDNELDTVLKNLKPYLEEQISKAGYIPLAWSKAGWVRFFARTPVLTPADLKKQKLATSAEAPSITDAFKAMGYQMIPTGYSEVIMGFNSGRIDAVFQSPVFAGGTQLFGIAKHMTNLNIAPFIGGIVINQTAWKRIPQQYQAALLEICKKTEKENDAVVAKLETDAIEAMTKYGLVIHNLNDAQKQLWYDDVASVKGTLIGSSFDRETTSKIEAILMEYRK
jgi:TRAP-type C4-dicarboxylate transport system substrate-binding protein